MCASLIVFLNWIVATGLAFSNVERCSVAEDTELFETVYCLATNDDVNLGCLRNKIPVISSIYFGVKPNLEDCTKRVLSSDLNICCKPKRRDVVYDGNCLQDIWSVDDSRHYRQLIHEATVKCKDTHNCDLTSNMFENLQKEIPSRRIYSSYLKVIYHCITAPTDPIDVCSKTSVTEKEIHLQSSSSGGSARTPNQTCTCQLTSQSSSGVIVRAIDVRTTKSGVILKSDYNSKDLSHRQLPLNGFSDIITGQNVEISVRNGQANTGDEVWLHVSGSGGQDVNVVCEGPVADARTNQPDTTTHKNKNNPIQPTGRVSTVKKKTKSEGYWPVIYLAAGSGITLVLIACIIGSLLICRCSLKKTKRRYENPYQPSQVNYNRSGQYDTVPGGMPNIPDSMTASIQDPYEWPHAFVK